MRPNVPPEAGVAVREPEPDEALDERLPLRVGAEVRRRSGPGQLGQHLGPVRREAGFLSAEERRVRREREQYRQPGEHPLEREHALLGPGHPDMDVQAADGLPPRRDPGVLDELAVARVWSDLLCGGQAEGVRPGGGDR